MKYCTSTNDDRLNNAKVYEIERDAAACRNILVDWPSLLNHCVLEYRYTCLMKKKKNVNSANLHSELSWYVFRWNIFFYKIEESR